MVTNNQPADLEAIDTVEALEAALSDPTPVAVEAMAKIDGDVVLLGVNGKMGPTLAVMAKRASELAGVKRRVIGVSRFSSGSDETRKRLEAHGVETVRCDLLDRRELKELPDADNVIFMAGMKFGSTGEPSTTWAMNAYLPGLVCEHYAWSRIAVFSTGNVYGLSAVTSGGSRETDEPQPIGEYAMSCLGRERVFEHFSRKHGTKMSIIRLNYAVEYRYGVIVDLALKIQRSEPIGLSVGHFNGIWQADANAMSLASLADAPPFVLNVAGPELLSVQQVASQLGEMMGIEPVFTGQPGADAYLSCGHKGHELYGYPRRPIASVIRDAARWVQNGGEVLNKPTKFESRDGRF
jgi:nucleoside-diphosphate-sugar epimerase